MVSHGSGPPLISVKMQPMDQMSTFKWVFMSDSQSEASVTRLGLLSDFGLAVEELRKHMNSS